MAETKTEVVEEKIEVPAEVKAAWLNEVKVEVKKELKAEMETEAKAKAIAEDKAAKKAVEGEKKEVKNEVKKTFENDKSLFKKALRKEFLESEVNVGFNFEELAEKKTIQLTTGSNQVENTVPRAQFTSILLETQNEYGVAMRKATVVQTDRQSIDVWTDTAEITMGSVNEGAKIGAVAMALPRTNIPVTKYAKTTLFSNEQIDDSGFDLTAIAARKFGRAHAKQQDQLVFTDATYGLLNVAGTVAVTLSGTGYANISRTKILEAIYGIPTAAAQNGEFYMNRQAWRHVMALEDSAGRPLYSATPVNGSTELMIEGYRVNLVEVMPGTSSEAPETAFIVFGDLKDVVMAVRNSMELKSFDEGTFNDGSNDINLAEQDAIALRSTQRYGARVVIPANFAVISTGASS